MNDIPTVIDIKPQTFYLFSRNPLNKLLRTCRNIEYVGMFFIFYFLLSIICFT